MFSVPPDRSLEIHKGGILTIPNGKTLHINGPFQAGLYQVFSGSSKVVFGPGTVAEVHPEWWGAKADGSSAAVTTSAIQAAVDSNASPIIFSKGQYRIDNTIKITAPVVLKGAGQFNSFILQTNPSAGAFFYNYSSPLPGGGVEDMSIHAGTLFNTKTGSNGVALQLTKSNGGFSSRRLDIQSFATGIKVTSSFYPKFQDFQVLYARDFGVLLAAPDSSPASAGVFISKAKISNYGFTGDNSKSIGLKIEQSGGDYIETVDITSFHNGLIVKPVPGYFVTYLFMNQLLADSSDSDNIVIDGSLSSVAAIEFVGSWAAYSTNGSGLVIKGRIDGVQWTGGRIRENGRHGVVLDGGDNITFVNTHIARNSKSKSLAFDGVRIKPGNASASFVSCRIGNFASGLVSEQADNFHIEKGFKGHLMIHSCDLRDQGKGMSPVKNLSDVYPNALNNLQN
jgi:hypothetical protein